MLIWLLIVKAHAHSQVTSSHPANQTATSGIVTLSDENISTIISKDGQHISPNTLDSIIQTENVKADPPCKKSPKGICVSVTDI